MTDNPSDKTVLVFSAVPLEKLQADLERIRAVKSTLEDARFRLGVNTHVTVTDAINRAAALLTEFEARILQDLQSAAGRKGEGA